MDEPTELERTVAKALEIAALDAGEHECPNTYEYALFATEEEWLILARAAIKATQQKPRKLPDVKDITWEEGDNGEWKFFVEGKEIKPFAFDRSKLQRCVPKEDDDITIIKRTIIKKNDAGSWDAMEYTTDSRFPGNTWFRHLRNEINPPAKVEK